jgi:ankyrin repeat protein
MLSIVIQSQQLEILNFILENNTDPHFNMPEKQKVSILHEAITTGNYDIVSVILEKLNLKNYILLKDSFGRISLFWAVINGYLDILELLLENEKLNRNGVIDYTSLYPDLMTLAFQKDNGTYDTLVNYSEINPIID